MFLEQERARKLRERLGIPQAIESLLEGVVDWHAPTLAALPIGEAPQPLPARPESASGGVSWAAATGVGQAGCPRCARYIHGGNYLLRVK